MNESIVMVIYEPRWHGFARWELQKRIGYHTDSIEKSSYEIAIRLERGWTRRKRGARCIQTRSETAEWTRYYLTGKTTNE